MILQRGHANNLHVVEIHNTYDNVCGWHWHVAQVLHTVNNGNKAKTTPNIDFFVAQLWGFTSIKLSFFMFSQLSARQWYRSFLQSILPFINSSSRLYTSMFSQYSYLSQNSFVFKHVHACFCLPIKSSKNKCQIKIQILRINWIAC